MNNIGKQGRININANRKLKKTFSDKGITECEIRLPGCFVNNFLGFAHRHKRYLYRGHPEMLGDPNQVLVACVLCHQKIESNKELTESVFNRLRGPDGLNKRND